MRLPRSRSPAQGLLLTQSEAASICSRGTTSALASGGSRCAVGGAERSHLRAQPRPALARGDPRAPASIYTDYFGRALRLARRGDVTLTRLEVEARLAGCEFPVAWRCGAPLYLSGMWLRPAATEPSLRERVFIRKPVCPSGLARARLPLLGASGQMAEAGDLTQPRHEPGAS